MAIVIDQVEQARARLEIFNVTVDDVVGHNYLMYVQYDNPVPVKVAMRNTIFSCANIASSGTGNFCGNPPFGVRPGATQWIITCRRAARL